MIKFLTFFISPPPFNQYLFHLNIPNQNQFSTFHLVFPGYPFERGTYTLHKGMAFIADLDILTDLFCFFNRVWEMKAQVIFCMQRFIVKPPDLDIGAVLAHAVRNLADLDCQLERWAQTQCLNSET